MRQTHARGRRLRVTTRQAWALLAAMALAGCAVNPATGKRQLVLVGEGQEVALGRENDATITAQMGLYEDEALAAYVRTVGARLAAVSERPGLEWTFRVLDDPVVNAFALPGGYLYVTRGILAHLASEAELAAVLGHEIGHVTARHGVSQMSKAQLAQLGLGLGSILAPETMASLGGLAETGLGLLFLKYGRDDERQADELGLRYMVRGGYDPRDMVGVFEMLGLVSASAGGERVPGWLSTHPAPENRRELAAARVAAVDPAGLVVGEDDYLRRLDGLVFGDDPRQGYFDGQSFYHPELRFRATFPEGWTTRNERDAVRAIADTRDAVVEITLSAASSAESALGQFFEQQGVTRTGPPMSRVHGLPTSGDGFVATAQQGVLEGRVGFVEHGGRVYRLLGYAAQASWPRVERAVRDALGSFDALSDPRRLAVEPGRLRVVRPAGRPTVAELARREGASVPLEQLALLNRLEGAGSTVVPARPFKIVIGGKRP
jgi:predicted Zn-dependent protease